MSHRPAGNTVAGCQLYHCHPTVIAFSAPQLEEGEVMSLATHLAVALEELAAAGAAAGAAAAAAIAA